MTTTRRPVYPRSGYEREHYGTCEMHGMPCCATCCRHEGECDYGACNKPAVTVVECFNQRGVVTERRPTCKRHAVYGPFGVGNDARSADAVGLAL